VDIGKEIAKVQRELTSGKVDKLLSTLSKEDSKSLIEAMNDLEISSRVIAGVLQNRGYKIGRDAINSWRHTNVPNFKTRSNHYMGDK
jgi:hypothetical protein